MPALEKRSVCGSSEILAGVDGLVCAGGELAGGQGVRSGDSKSRRGDPGCVDMTGGDSGWSQQEQSREEGCGPAWV